MLIFFRCLNRVSMNRFHETKVDLTACPVLEWQPCHSYAEVLFSQKLSYYRNVSLAVYSAIPSNAIIACLLSFTFEKWHPVVWTHSQVVKPFYRLFWCNMWKFIFQTNLLWKHFHCFSTPDGWNSCSNQRTLDGVVFI